MTAASESQAIIQRTNMVGILTLHLLLHACTSLKEKRRRIKPLLHRLHKEFNLTVAEMDRQDNWREAIIACAMIGNDAVHLQNALQTVLRWVEDNWPDADLAEHRIELL